MMNLWSTDINLKVAADKYAGELSSKYYRDVTVCRGVILDLSDTT